MRNVWTKKNDALMSRYSQPTLVKKTKILTTGGESEASTLEIDTFSFFQLSLAVHFEERKALREPLDAALTRSDAGSIVPRVILSETMFMLMPIHLKSKINELEERRE